MMNRFKNYLQGLPATALVRSSCGLACCMACMACMAFLGCTNSDSGIVLCEVQGCVRLDDQPVPNAKVLFVPVNKNSTPGKFQPVSFAITDERGCFELRTSQQSLGAVPGLHYVLISKIADEENAESGGTLDTNHRFGLLDPELIASLNREQIPARYNVESILRFRVPEVRSTTADFELQTIDPLIANPERKSPSGEM